MDLLKRIRVDGIYSRYLHRKEREKIERMVRDNLSGDVGYEKPFCDGENNRWYVKITGGERAPTYSIMVWAEIPIDYFTFARKIQGACSNFKRFYEKMEADGQKI